MNDGNPDNLESATIETIESLLKRKIILEAETK